MKKIDESEVILATITMICQSTGLAVAHKENDEGEVELQGVGINMNQLCAIVRSCAILVAVLTGREKDPHAAIKAVIGFLSGENLIPLRELSQWVNSGAVDKQVARVVAEMRKTTPEVNEFNKAIYGTEGMA